MNSILRNGLIFACVVIAAVVYWGCSDDDGTPTDPGPKDTDPPQVSSVTATEVRSIDVVFDEAVDKTTAEDKANYFFVKPVPAATETHTGFESPAQGPDTLLTVSAILHADGKTVTAATDGDMQSGSYNYHVSGVEDLAGNAMTSTATGSFTGNTTPDDTPPTIVFRSPAPDETGVDVLESVVIQFSEAMQVFTVSGAFLLSNGGGVLTDMYVEAGNTYRFDPTAPLARDTEYVVNITTDAMDMAGNRLAATTWKFRTTSTDDNTPPRFVSSIPDDQETNVPLDTNIELQFSEAINQDTAERIIMAPVPGDGVETWSPDGSKLTFNPNQDLQVDTQYTILIPAGGVEDLAGNSMNETVEITFTTGSTFESGRISGRLSGDSGSQDASNPEGALVFASTEDVFESDGPPEIFGTAIASSNGNYDIQNLPDNTYYVAAILDSNDDGEIDPGYGDALGMYGVDFDAFDFEPDTVVVSGGNHVGNVNFELFDFSAVSGTVYYVGTAHWDDVGTHFYYVGMFEASGFDPSSDPVPEPDYISWGDNLLYDPEFVLNELEDYISDGTYYMGAFLDLDWDGMYDEGVEPAGFYEVGGQPATVTLQGGSDATGIDIYMEDAGGGGGGSGTASIVWKREKVDNERSEQAREARRLLKALKQALRQSDQ
jgi:hypothetical protein